MRFARVLRTALVVGSILVCASISSAVGQGPPSQPGSQDRASPPQPGQRQMPPGQHPAAPRPGRRPEASSAKKGLIVNSAAAFTGYTLFAPLNSTTTYLIDMKGNVTHSWPSKYTPGQAVHLLDDGSLLRCGREPNNQHFGGGGIGGRVQRIAPNGKVQWQFVYADRNHCLHHDIEPLPNGNVLMIAWEKKTRAEAIAAGLDDGQFFGEEIWPDCIIEVKPQGTTGGQIVWEWHVWNHLVQDFDEDLPNYGVVAEHPELVDLNYSRRAPVESSEELRRLRALGYIGGRSEEENEAGPGNRRPGGGPGGPDMMADWCHTNAVAYNAELDQIALSVHSFNEIWIIDHSTTTKEAAGHRGGRYGRGGDLLYRWGNPRAYGAGGAGDQQFFSQHDVRWIPEGTPGAGHLLVFNNGGGRPDGQYSSVVEIVPPVDSSGRYKLKKGQAFGPEKPCWEYAATNKQDFFSRAVSGVQRLANGNTLICSGEPGRLFEVTADGKIVWEYVNEHAGNPGMFGPGGPPGGGRRPPPPGGRPDGRRGPPDGGPGGPSGRGFGGPGPPAGSSVFRATRLALDDAGVKKLLGNKRSKRKPSNRKRS